jgi:hypothetical protein
LIFTARWAWVLAAGLVLSACGGSGGGDTNAGAPTPAPAPPIVQPPADPAAIPTAVDFPAQANDIEWSEQHQLLYLALPAVNGPSGNSVVALDPRTNRVAYSQLSCSEPVAVTLSDDQQALHVACSGTSTVQRYRLPELTLEHEFFLGREAVLGIPFKITDMVAVPGQRRSVVVALSYDGEGRTPSITRVYDNGVPRPVELGVGAGDCFSLGWDLTRTRLLCAKTANSSFALQEAVLAADGLSVARSTMYVFNAFNTRIAVDAATGIVYGDDGTVFDPVTWRTVGRTALRGPVAPDSARNRLFVASASERFVRSLDATTWASTTSFVAGSSQPRRLIRWGANGLAMTTFGGSVLLYGGSGMSTFDAQTPRSTATERVVPVQVKQLAWDAAGGRLYATVGADAPQYANAVVAIDPANGQVTQSRALGTAPNALAVSGDGRYLYVGLDGEGSVQRLRLPGLEHDLTFSLGQRPFYGTPYTAGVIQVSPTQPNTVAVARAAPNVDPYNVGGVVLFDDAVQRPVIAGGETATGLFRNAASLVWNEDGAGLLALDGVSGKLWSFQVVANGLTSETPLGPANDLGPPLRFDKVNRLLLTDRGGALDLATLQPRGNYRPAAFASAHHAAPDPAGKDVFTLYLAEPDYFAPVSEIAVYDAVRFVPKKIYAITGNNERFTDQFLQLHPGWFAFRSPKGLHLVQLPN